MSGRKTYLGDGAYADFDGYSVILTTEDGIRATNTIVLEPEIMRALISYAMRVGIRGVGEVKP